MTPTAPFIAIALWMDSADLPVRGSTWGMATVTMDAAAVRALAERVRRNADQLAEIHWPSPLSTEVTGAAVAAATTAAPVRDLLADVVAGMRTWATAVATTVAAVEQVDRSVAARLDQPR